MHSLSVELVEINVLLSHHFSSPAAGRTSCGRTGEEAEPGWRIVFGRASREQQWPWQVHILIRGRFLCGGSLIDETTVITAAHCGYKEGR